MKPLVPLTDPRFLYVPSHKTDIRQTFERVRAQQTQPANVRPIKRKAK